MGVEGVKEGFLFRGGGFEAVGGSQPLVNFCLLSFGVGQVAEGRHCSLDATGCEPNGAWKNSCGEQLGGSGFFVNVGMFDAERRWLKNLQKKKALACRFEPSSRANVRNAMGLI